MQRYSRHIYSVLVGAFIAVCLYGVRGDFASVSLAPVAHSFDLVLLAALFSLLNYCLRIFRWQRYLGVLGFALPIGFTGLTYIAGFAFTVSPGKVGELARGRYYSRLGMSVSDVAGAFFVERLMDVIAMLALATLIFESLPRYRAAMWGAALLVAVVLGLLASLPWDFFAGALTQRADSASRQLVKAGARLAAGLARALVAARSLLKPGVLLYGFLLGMVAWGLEGLGVYVLGFAFSPMRLDPASGVGIYAVAVLVGALSFLPGGLGSTEAVMTALLAARGYSVANALLITILCRALTLWLAVLIGWVAVFLLRRDKLLPAAI